jgi:hypothetical protein
MSTILALLSFFATLYPGEAFHYRYLDAQLQAQPGLVQFVEMHDFGGIQAAELDLCHAGECRTTFIFPGQAQEETIDTPRLAWLEYGAVVVRSEDALKWRVWPVWLPAIVKVQG